ncbi:YdcF family protein [Pseudarthrobacter sp. P1]|uniref:YdcF family protein n=1 Tax=Pseudarthrobacter sp. P1 TaxID=3418418 RepID=UPI003CEEDE3D
MPRLLPQTARRPLVQGTIAVAALLSLWLVAAIVLFANPPQSAPQHADAVIMLGGASRERLPVALGLAENSLAPTLAISHTNSAGNVSADALCNYAGVINVKLECFKAGTLDTRGEAAAIADLIAAKGWHSVVVVTSRYHATRAQTLISQCTSAHVQMIVSEPKISIAQWLRRFVIETGGLLDAWLSPQCKAPR